MTTSTWYRDAAADRQTSQQVCALPSPNGSTVSRSPSIPVEARQDVLTFTGEAISRPLDLAGPVTARLRLATDGPSMHVFAKLVDVFPDGRAVMLLRGQATVAGSDVTLADIYLGHTGYRVEAGHRLRLHVASSDFPLYLAHPGTGENPWFATVTRTNRQTLFAGEAVGSHLGLTVLESQ